MVITQILKIQNVTQNVVTLKKPILKNVMMETYLMEMDVIVYVILKNLLIAKMEYVIKFNYLSQSEKKFRFLIFILLKGKYWCIMNRS